MGLKIVRNYINEEWVDSSSSSLLDVMDPASGEVLARVPLSTRSEVDDAVQAAQEAFWEWRTTPPLTRARYFFRLKEVLEENFEELSRITTREAGKTLDESRGELRRAIEMVEVACGIPTMMMGQNLEDIASGIDCVATRQPLGVFAAITPYNFPTMVPFWFWPFAVACGNTYIVKPSEQDPLTQQFIFELLDEEIGFPPGVINLVNGGQESVEALLEHPQVKGISFVGSSKVARIVYQKCGETGKRVQSLGGAKNFLVVMPDANLDATVGAIILSAFGCAGQRCLAGSTIITVGDIYEPFKHRLLEAARKMTVGHGLDEKVQMGPVISAVHKQRVLNYIEQGVAEGAKLLLDGRGIIVEGGEKGFFIGPTIFDQVNPDMVIAQEEIFGPVLGLTPVDSLDEAISIIQKNNYGNATCIFTSSGKSAREFTYRAECSMMGINIGIAAPMAFFPFGGTKDSFFGDIKGHGSEIVDFFTDRKVIISRWL
ncbi:CoA-acylating methylmalonate-semialdehyde dehydrogenase [candidate division CSSED10-310 bacterium]|uniref:methylmalonate-semialdehyde dehydrogenase (CoA acylating) n=1 Tax=candidate division CSSED10-310 bacterium TaxID=2855610 RepID=A0ABV6YTH4_UNCC1